MESKSSFKKQKVVLIGSGKMGMHHLNGILSHSNAELIGILDPRIKKLPEILPPNSNVKIFSSAEKLFSQLHPDVAHIVTPAHTHYDLAQIALENNCHIYVEKPFTLNLKETRELFSSANRKGLKVCAGHQLLFQDPTKVLNKLIHKIAPIVHVESYFSFRTVRKSISPIDQLIDILPHPVYTLLHFMGVNSIDSFKVMGINSDFYGNLHVLIDANDIKGLLMVTLQGRPVDSYLKIIGKYGSLYADYVRGIVIQMTGSGADAIAAIMNPYRQSVQTIWKSTKSFTKMVLGGKKGYAGLNELFGAFYDSILEDSTPPVTETNIYETVRLCEFCADHIREKLLLKEIEIEKNHAHVEKKIPNIYSDRGIILVTGGTGFLGKCVVEFLRSKGWLIRVISRNPISKLAKIAGVEYITADLVSGLSDKIFENVSTIIHCAAETAGGQTDHERNSLEATRNLIETAGKHGIKEFIHISSIAVLNPNKSNGKLIDENTPLDSNNLSRGPYVWGKAQSEELARILAKKLKIRLRVIRPGPLVDFENFEAPGRLGREIGTRFVVIGNKKSNLYLCDVKTVARVLHYYLLESNNTPQTLNLVEEKKWTRQALLNKLIENRKDLSGIFVPTWVVKLISYFLIVVQKLLNPRKKPMNVYTAFASEEYNISLASEIINKAKNYN